MGLSARSDTVVAIVRAEEEAFLATLKRGEKLLQEALQQVSTSSPSTKGTLPASLVFELYDRFGFPFDLTEVIAKENNATFDYNQVNGMLIPAQA